MKKRNLWCCLCLTMLMGVGCLLPMQAAALPDSGGDVSSDAGGEDSAKLNYLDDDTDVVLSVEDVEIKLGESTRIPIKLEKSTEKISELRLVLSTDNLKFDANVGVEGNLKYTSNDLLYYVNNNEHRMVLVWGSGQGENPSCNAFEQEQTDELIAVFVTAPEWSTLDSTFRISIDSVTVNGESKTFFCKEGKMSIGKSGNLGGDAAISGEDSDAAQLPNDTQISKEKGLTSLDVMIFGVVVIISLIMIGYAIFMLRRINSDRMSVLDEGNIQKIKSNMKEMRDTTANISGKLQKLQNMGGDEMYRLESVIDKIVGK